MEPRHVDALLIGGGVAAARCARALRRAGFSGSIALVGEEDVVPYNRPPLSKELLREEVPLDLVLAEPPSWYERRGVEMMLGTRAASLDPGERLVALADGRSLSYGACLLATGAAPRRLEVPGGEAVLLLRTLHDAVELRSRAVAGARAVVIGGGFIGVEAGASLAARGVDVTLLCGAPLLWNGAFGAAVSDWAVDRLADVGVSVRFEAVVTEVSEGAVRVDDEALPAELVMAGVGVRPRVELATAAGLDVDDGVLVDENQATSAPGLFAAGDVARPRGEARVEHWHAARESGERAGLAMAVAPLSPRHAPWIFSEFAGAKLDVFGSLSGGEEEVAVSRGVHAWLRNGLLAQLAVLDGAISPDTARSLVERGARLDEIPR